MCVREQGPVSAEEDGHRTMCREGLGFISAHIRPHWNHFRRLGCCGRKASGRGIPVKILRPPTLGKWERLGYDWTVGC